MRIERSGVWAPSGGENVKVYNPSRNRLGRSAMLAGIFAVMASPGSAQWRSESPPWNSVMRQQAADKRSAGRPSTGPSNNSVPSLKAPGGTVPPTPILTSVTRPGNVAPAAFVNPEPQARHSRVREAIKSLAAGRRVVAFTASFPAGAIVVVNSERALYHVGDNGAAVRYPVAIGSMTEAWTGVEFVTDKKVNPPWHPVVELGKEIKQPVAGGDPTNPLGVRALYLGRTLWRIHGTPAADSIGQAVSNGCIRMHNEHVVELYDNVPLGAEVYVVERLTDGPPSSRGRKILEQTATSPPPPSSGANRRQQVTR